MEYEISDEERMFDESTNPSLLHGTRPIEPPRSVKPQGDPAHKERLQKAEVIPEEEQQAA